MDEWWKAQPPVTKWFLAGAFGFTLAGNFGLISPVTMIFDLELVWRNFHIWRLFTCALFMGKLGFPFLINLFYFYKYSGELETNSFTGDTAGYVWFFTIIWGLLLTVAALMNNRLIGGSLTMAVIYLWANRNGDRTITFWFGIKFKAIYFPWALTVLTVLLGGSPVSRLIGIAVGHVYYFLEDLYPTTNGGVHYIKTPAFMYSIFPRAPQQVVGLQGGMAMPGQVPPPARNNNWQGQGHVLGAN